MSDVVLAALIAPVALIVQGLLQSWMQARRDREERKRDDLREAERQRRAEEVAAAERGALVDARRLEAFEALVRAAYAYRQERASEVLEMIGLAEDVPDHYYGRTLFTDDRVARPSKKLEAFGEAAGVARVWASTDTAHIVPPLDELVRAVDQLEIVLLTGTTKYEEVQGPWSGLDDALRQVVLVLGADRANRL